jgi:hypothetical protein
MWKRYALAADNLENKLDANDSLGHRPIHQERGPTLPYPASISIASLTPYAVWFSQGRYLALRCWTQLWKLRDTRFVKRIAFYIVRDWHSVQQKRSTSSTSTSATAPSSFSRPSERDWTNMSVYRRPTTLEEVISRKTCGFSSDFLFYDQFVHGFFMLEPIAACGFQAHLSKPNQPRIEPWSCKISPSWSIRVNNRERSQSHVPLCSALLYSYYP